MSLYQDYMNMPMPMTVNGQYPRTFNQTIRQEVVRVHGENGARAYQMAANSSALLLDDTEPIVWLAQTDGAGYKTVTPFSIKPFQVTPPVDINLLEERITRLEAKFNESDIVTNECTDNKHSASKTSVEQSKSAK